MLHQIILTEVAIGSVMAITVLNVRLWHKADMNGLGSLPCTLTSEPHFAGRKSLL
jgi:hypothetical protein